MNPAILYMAIIHKSKSTSKSFGLNHTKTLLHKLKKDNVNVAKTKNERVNIKRSKTPRRSDNNNNGGGDGGTPTSPAGWTPTSPLRRLLQRTRSTTTGVVQLRAA